MIDEQSTIEVNTEMRDLARVIKAAFLMIVRYLEKRYKV